MYKAIINIVELLTSLPSATFGLPFTCKNNGENNGLRNMIFIFPDAKSRDFKGDFFPAMHLKDYSVWTNENE